MAWEEGLMINFGYNAQHPHAYLPGAGPSLFGAQKFSIKGENWIALMVISDHN